MIYVPLPSALLPSMAHCAPTLVAKAAEGIPGMCWQPAAAPATPHSPSSVPYCRPLSPQGPFCQVDNTHRTCQVSETFTLTNGGRKTHVVMCLPQRSRTLAGCLCSAIWSERDDVHIARTWPPIPAEEMAQGLHEGWLMAGNCSRALTLTGGRAKLPGGRRMMLPACAAAAGCNAGMALLCDVSAAAASVVVCGVE